MHLFKTKVQKAFKQLAFCSNIYKNIASTDYTATVIKNPIQEVLKTVLKCYSVFAHDIINHYYSMQPFKSTLGISGKFKNILESKGTPWLECCYIRGHPL